MSSLFVCNPIRLSQEELSKITTGSGISPAAFSGGASAGDQDGYSKLAAALEAAEARERKTAAVNRALAIGSFGIAVLGLYLTWRQVR